MSLNLAKINDLLEKSPHEKKLTFLGHHQWRCQGFIGGRVSIGWTENKAWQDLIREFHCLSLKRT